MSEPETIPGYTLREKLGKGAAGEVWRAWDEGCQREVAVKLLGAGLPARALERFQREARLAGGLEHPNLVPVFSAGTTSRDRPYLVMSLVDGPSLDAVGTSLGWRGAARVVSRLADALHYAHQAGVVHRDVKPANVVLDPRGEPRLLDFGLARAASLPSLTTTGSVVVGTPRYAPPELLRGETQDAGAVGDVYGLGGVLYFLLEGRAPFAELESAAALASARAESLAFEGEAPSDLVALCRRALESDPSQRFPSCGELAGALNRVLEPGSAEAPPADEAPPEEGVGQAWALIGLGLLVLAGAIGVGLLL